MASSNSSNKPDKSALVGMLAAPVASVAPLVAVAAPVMSKRPVPAVASV